MEVLDWVLNGMSWDWVLSGSLSVVIWVLLCRVLVTLETLTDGMDI